LKPILNNTEDYIQQIPDGRKPIFLEILHKIRLNIPDGFQECINYGMIGFVVPKKIYTPGYHCDSRLPLPFVNLASQKNYIALYHMGIYSNSQLLDWFQKEYKDQCKYKLDMGKSCIRFKRMDDIPLKLIGELMKKMTPEQWIAQYEESIR